MAILDNETIETLKDVLADDFALLIDTFLSDAPKRIEEIKNAIASTDIAAIEAPVHTLKGSSGNIGGNDLFAACEALLVQVRENQVLDPVAMLGAIEAEYARLKPELESML
ncbi:MAG: Hpt domain-containing protein [Gammaproteobacteria bacterium]|nr:Hpt domain-containing protein [Gammaproteobacteria bacterium]MDH5728407.1 Hpt domain-containing protein [Gammaproteobacteria bacterium]